LSNGVRGIGGGLVPSFSTADLIQLVEPQRPTHLIITFPHKGLIQWALRQKIAVLPVLADSFNARGWKAKFRNFLLARLLNHRQIIWVANHNTNSSKALQAIGVRADKIIPYDWLPTITPDRFAAKTLQQNDQPFTLFFAGSVTQSKGVGDVLNALALLQSRGLNVHLKLAGNGEIAHFQEQIQQLNIADRAEFLGLIPNDRVVFLMREADVVVIPSRHEYPEGLPLTIYEALCSHTPIVASDHPMFRDKLVDQVSALIFPAQDASALADRLIQLTSDPTIYNTLSANSTKAWDNLQVPVKLADLLNRWVFDSPANQEWLYRYRLASGQYL
jgi:glycosyltransferase involved in cell wall biosynthesis